MDLYAAAANAATDGIVDNLNSGYVLFHTSGNAEVAKCPMNNPAFDDAGSSGGNSDGQAAMETGTDVKDTTTTAGTVDHAHLLNSSSALWTKLTCGTSGAEINFSSLTFGDNEELKVTGLTVGFTSTSAET